MDNGLAETARKDDNETSNIVRLTCRHVAGNLRAHHISELRLVPIRIAVVAAARAERRASLSHILQNLLERDGRAEVVCHEGCDLAAEREVLAGVQRLAVHVVRRADRLVDPLPARSLLRSPDQSSPSLGKNRVAAHSVARPLLAKHAEAARLQRLDGCVQLLLLVGVDLPVARLDEGVERRADLDARGLARTDGGRGLSTTISLPS